MTAHRRPILTAALTALAVMLLCAVPALAQGTQLSASASPDAYYEPFDSDITVQVLNSGDTDISVTSLKVEDIVLPGTQAILAPGESADLAVRLRITDAMLDAGHFYVTVYYTYTGSDGLSIPSIDQILVPVRRMEDSIEARLRFALPDRPIDGEERVLVSYILENYGETDMADAVIICYPEGAFSAPMTVRSGTSAVVKRLVSVEDLDKISAKVSAVSAYSGKEFMLEQAYEGDLMELAMSAEAYQKTLPSARSAAQMPKADGEPAQGQMKTSDAPDQPQISAGSTGEDLLIRVAAGSKTLTEIQLFANEEPVRTLVLLRSGLETALSYRPKAAVPTEYTVRMQAVDSDGETVEIASDPVLWQPKEEDSRAAEEESDFLSALLEAPRLTGWITGICGAALAVLAVAAIVKHAKKRAVLEEDEEDEAKDGELEK